MISLLRQLAPVLVVLVLYAAFAGIQCGLPLFNVLGYEFAFVMAIVGSFAAMHLSVVQMHRLRQRRTDPLTAPLSPAGGVFHLYLRAAGTNLLLLVLPLSILSANAVDVRNCNYFNGLAWFFVLPVVSVAVASAWGVALGLLPWHRRWSLLGGYLVILGSLAWGVWRFYSEPPVCQYDPFAGYFSGNLYDDHVVITTSVMGARVYHLMGALTVLLVAARFYLPGERRLAWRHGEPRGRLSLTGLGAFVVTVGLYFAGGPLAYTVTGRDIARELGGVHHSPHFIIHYPEGSRTAREIRLHAADAEFHWHQLRRFFGAAPAHKIRIYLFRDDAQKRRLYGAAQVDMAKPWRLEVSLTQQPFPHPVLRHELAHTFAAVFGDRMFGVSVRWERVGWILPVPYFNPGLIEGAAVAAAWTTRGELTPHQWARALHKLRKAPPMAAVMSYAFLAATARRSYTLAGSFCRFLIERRGAASFRRVYKNGGDFRAVYGRSLGQLAGEWKRFLGTVPLTDRELGLARERFRPQPVFGRPCVHEVARLDHRAARFMGRGQFHHAARTYRRICGYDPGDPGHLLGLLAAHAAANRRRLAQGVAREIWRHRATTPPLKARTLWTLGNLAWRAGDLSRARRLFTKAASYPVSEGGQRDLEVRLMALADSKLGQSLRPLMVPGPQDSPEPEGWNRLTTTHPDLGLAYYLRGANHLQQDEFGDAARHIARSLELGLPDARFQREALRRLGRSYFRAGDLQRARQTFTALTQPTQAQAVRLWAGQWIARCDFWEKHGPALGLGDRP